MFVGIYLYRISVEERMLGEELGGDYAAYRRRTRRLVPFLY
jgi:protein-S-isoprenylcysteine O-methyltransferase Ste14